MLKELFKKYIVSNEVYTNLEKGLMVFIIILSIIGSFYIGYKNEQMYNIGYNDGYNDGAVNIMTIYGK